MPVNTELSGAHYELDPVCVTREAIAAFARATQAELPVHTDPAAAQALGHPDVIAPPTFAVTIAQQAEGLYVQDPNSGIDFAKVVHGSEQFSFQRPIFAHDCLRAVTHVDSVRAAGAHAMITTRTEITDAHDDSPVVTVTSALVVRGDAEGEQQ